MLSWLRATRSWPRRPDGQAARAPPDLLVAATAHAHDTVLVTANPKEVKHLTALIEVSSP